MDRRANIMRKDEYMITVNGRSSDGDGMVIREFLDTHGYQDMWVAVEINEEIIPREEHETFRIQEGDVVEVVQFMGGGSAPVTIH